LPPSIFGTADSLKSAQFPTKISIEPNHAAGVKLIFLILTVASAGILFYYVTAALKMSKRKPYG
jgi:hypothetical protein